MKLGQYKGGRDLDMQHLNHVLIHDSANSQAADESNPSGLGDVLSELSRDVAGMRRLLEDLTQRVDASRFRRTSAARNANLQRSGSSEHHRQAVSSSNRRSSAASSDRYSDLRPVVRSELERACRIALMESNGAVSVEAIYDRINRRGSFTFARYKHPFRAIMLAMGAMVRHGEACLCNEGGLRRWRSTAFDNPPVL